MGLPLFENPHLLPQTTEPATRAELFSIQNGETIAPYDFEDEKVVQELDKLLRKRVRYEAIVSMSPQSSKRRRLEDDDEHEGKGQEEQLVLFRLVSSAKDPRLVSLLPAPSPPTLTRAPDSEDTEAQAAVRKKRAEAASIDGETILRSSATLQPAPSTEPVSMQLCDAIPNPPRLIVLEKTQKSRKSRPPVTSTELLYYPYTADAPPPSLLGTHKTKCLVAAIKELEPESASTTPNRRSGHQRKSTLIAQPPKDRPPPQFWRPSPGMTGKCQGYAYGYPGSFLAAAEARGHVNETSAQKYKHDTMKRGSRLAK